MDEAVSAVVEAREVCKWFYSQGKRTDALERVNLSIPPSQFMSIVGPSGCGKSTLLKMMAGFVHPSSGDVLLQGKPVRGIDNEQGIGYVPQDDLLFPWLTAAQNIEFPLRVRGWPKATRTRRVQELLEMVGLTEAGGKFIYQLSGGMKKRVAIAQALSYDPSILLMDEPFGPLDSQTRMLLQQELLDIWTGTGKTVVFVTHDLVEAITLSDVVTVMTKPPARIKRVLEISLARPRNVFRIHSEKDFAGIYEELWPLLHDELK